MDAVMGQNIGAFIASKFALQRTAFGAGGGGDLAETDGIAIDRLAKRPLHLSAKVQAGWKLTLASGNTCAFTVSLLECDTSGGTYTVIDDAGTPATKAQTITALDAGTAQYGVVELDVNLIGAQQFLKVRVAGDLSASGSDTGEVFALLAVGGGETIPPVETDA